MITAEIGGVEKSLSDWGIALIGAGCLRNNMRPDIYRFAVPKANFASAPDFDWLDEIIIRRGRTGAGTEWDDGYIAFRGYRLDPRHDARSDSDFHYYTFGNAWYFLENTPFQQQAAAFIVSAVGFQFQTGLVLFTKISEGHATDPDEPIGTLPGFLLWITSGKQIKEVLKHALAMYTAQGFDPIFQIGTIEPDLILPSYPCQEISCAAAIIKALELSPNAVVYWDYTTAPPTIHVKSRSSLVPVTLPVKDDENFESLGITPLVTNSPSVVIFYFRIIGDDSGTQYVQYARQKYGPNGLNDPADPDGGLFAVIQTIDIAGPNYQRAYVKTREVVAHDASTVLADPDVADVRAWWASVKPELADTRLRYTSFAETEIVDADTGDPVSLDDFPYMLDDGSTLQDWMKLGDGTPVVGKRVRITTKWTYDKYDVPGTGVGDPELFDNGIKLEEVSRHSLSWQGTLTNATTGTYSVTTSAGEAIPDDLAVKVWNNLNEPAYEGEHVIKEDEITGQIGMANTLNLSGGHADWTDMAALIQSIYEDDGTGMTTITLGAPKQLNSGDLAAIWRFNRNRVPSPNLRSRETALP